MYKYMKREYYIEPTKISCTKLEVGESIEEMLRRLTYTKEPIPSNVPPIYTEEKDGVIPDTDIRHDRFDTAYEATDKFAASEIAKSANAIQGKEEENAG